VKTLVSDNPFIFVQHQQSQVFIGAQSLKAFRQILQQSYARDNGRGIYRSLAADATESYYTAYLYKFDADLEVNRRYALLYDSFHWVKPNDWIDSYIQDTDLAKEYARVWAHCTKEQQYQLWCEFLMETPMINPYLRHIKRSQKEHRWWAISPNIADSHAPFPVKENAYRWLVYPGAPALYKQTHREIKEFFLLKEEKAKQAKKQQQAQLQREAEQQEHDRRVQILEKYKGKK